MVINEQSKTRLSQLTSSWPHGVIIHGPDGSGKKYAILEQIKYLHPDAQEQIDHGNWEYLYVIEPDEGKKSVGIAQVKEIEQLINLRVEHPRYVLVDQAHMLTREAQNAFLKTLEEPPENIRIILLSSTLDALLPTIRSRSQAIGFQSPTQEQFIEYLTKQHNTEPATALRLYHVTNGGIRTALELLDNNEELSNATKRIDDAKQFLTGDSSSKLAIAGEYIKQTNGALEFCNAVLTVAKAALKASRGEAQKHTEWAQRCQKISKAIKRLENHVQPRLVLAELMLEL